MLKKRDKKKFYIMVGVFIIIIVSTITFRSFIKDAFVHDPSLKKDLKNKAQISE